MRFEAFDAEIYPGLDVCKPEVPTLVTFQHGVENRKWCDFHHYAMVIEMCVRQLVQGSTVFIAADQPETSRQQTNTETRNVRPPELKMADFNPEVATPTFAAMPDSDMTLPTWPDIARHLE